MSTNTIEHPTWAETEVERIRRRDARNDMISQLAVALTIFGLLLFALAAARDVVGNFIKKRNAPDDETHEMVFGEEFHLLLPHNVGDPREDENGCPCLCVHCGFPSYDFATNAWAHGIESVWEYMPSENDIIRMSSENFDSAIAKIKHIIEEAGGQGHE